MEWDFEPLLEVACPAEPDESAEACKPLGLSDMIEFCTMRRRSTASVPERTPDRSDDQERASTTLILLLPMAFPLLFHFVPILHIASKFTLQFVSSGSYSQAKVTQHFLRVSRNFV